MARSHKAASFAYTDCLNGLTKVANCLWDAVTVTRSFE